MGPIVVAVADNVPQATVAAEADTEGGKAAVASIADPRTAWHTTTGYHDRPGMANGRRVKGSDVDSQDLGKTDWRDIRNAAGKSTA